MSRFTNAMDGKFAPHPRTPRVSLTENGALTNASTFNAVLDFYSKSGAMRGYSVDFTRAFIRAYQEDKLLAVRALFQARDVRGGNGEKANPQAIYRWLALNDYPVFEKIVKWIPHFGYWKDIMDMAVDVQCVRDLVFKQFYQDLRDADLGKPVSLVAKWMPSENASSEKSKRRARIFAEALQMTPRQYRRSLSRLRHIIGIVEALMSDRRWEDVNYSRVPSQAMKLYRKAFGKHDPERFGEFIEAAKRGEKKINAGTLSPVQLVEKAIYHEDSTIEALWRQLPNYMQDRNMLVVADTSASMNGAPLHTAVALALYAAERNHGPFHNRWMNFSTHPSWQIVKGSTLHEKFYHMDKNNWDGSTDVEAVFKMILSTAVHERLAQEDLPAIVTIISDMQFNPSSGGRFFTNFDTIRAAYRNAGYEAPVIVWWNVRASNGQPAVKDDRGAIMVSGESAAAFKGLMECDVTKLVNMTPMSYMLEQLNGERYGVVTL